MTTIFFHIGARKTGTSYVQETLSHNAEALGPLGLHYLRTGREPFGHHALPRAAKWNDRYYQLRGEIEEELAGTTNNVLVSSENLELLEEPHIERILALFPEAESRVLFLFRSWGPLLYASWQEEVKHGSAQSYDHFCLSHFALPEESAILNFKIPIERWARVVGRDRVSLAFYDACVKTENLCALILRWAGVNHNLSFPNWRANESLDPFSAEAIRALNEMAISCGYKSDLSVRERYFDVALKNADENYGKVLSEQLRLHAKEAIDLNLSPVAHQFFDSFLRDYESLMIDDAFARATAANAAGKTHTVVTPGYFWSTEARRALMEYWLWLMPELGKNPRIHESERGTL